MLERLLPDGVVAVETRAERLATTLFPEEDRALGNAVDKRRNEFVSGRACARMALRALGISAVPIGIGPRGAPRWPAGVRGSITHCRGYCACAATTSPRVLAIGIDAEPHAHLPVGVLEAVAGKRERQWVRTAPPSGVCFDRLLFSAKEAIYKSWFPLAGERLGFEDVEVTIDPADAVFTGRLLIPPPAVDGRSLTELHGRWDVDEDIIVTAVVVPAAGASAREAVESSNDASAGHPRPRRRPSPPSRCR